MTPTPEQPPSRNPRLRHDPATMTCPLCQHSFSPRPPTLLLRRSPVKAAYRAACAAARPLVTVPTARTKRPITVYECPDCGERALGQQRCADCSTFMRKVGPGGEYPCCAEPIPLTELLDQEVITPN